jgi:hypothetical protein
MFTALYNSIKSSFLGILKVSLILLFFGITALLAFKSNNTSAYSVSSLSSLLSSATKINQLNTQLEEAIPSADLHKLNIKDITPEEAEIFLFILRLSNTITPTEARKLAKVIVDECSTYELDPFLILAIIQTESNFTPKAVSPRGAIGLMQVMPKTGEYVAKDRGITYKGMNSLYDPFLNVKLGIHYLSFLSDQFDSVENALAAYNYGPSKFAKSKTLSNNPPKYVKKVLNFKSLLEEESILLAKNS